MIAKNDRTYVLAGSSKARHGSRLITVLPYTVTVLIPVLLFNLVYQWFVRNSQQENFMSWTDHKMLKHVY